MPDSTDILTDWRIAEKRSSRGPWQATSLNPFLPGAQIKLYDADGHEVKIEVGDERHVWRTSDADFIVAARTAMPRLLTAVESVLRLCDARDNAPGRYAALAHTSDIRRAITDALSTESSNSGSEHA